jgi:hypothetical protein
MQFAVPDFFEYVPIKAPVPQAQVLGNFQDGGFNAVMSSDVEMFNAPKMSAVDASATTIGEHVQNLRPLTRRFGHVYSGSMAADHHLLVHSNYFGPVADSTSMTTEVSVTPLDYISHLYRFYRGSTKYKYFVTPAQSGLGSKLSAYLQPCTIVPVAAPSVGGSPSTILTQLKTRGGTFAHIVDSLYNRVLEVTSPYFSNTHISLIRGNGAQHYATQDRANLLRFQCAGTSAEVELMKAGGDDFSFGWLVGPPKIAKRIGSEPTGTMNLTGIDTIETTAGFVSFITTTTSNGSTGLITYSSVPTFTITYTDTTTEVVEFTNCRVNSTESSLIAPYDDTKTIDTVVTYAALNMIGIIPVRIGV